MSRRGPPFARATLGILTSSILLGLLEASSYLFGNFAPRRDPLITERSADWSATQIYDDLLFWRLRPNSSTKTLSINSQGLRSPEIPAERGQEFRALSLGESTTFGVGVAAAETYSALLERNIGEVHGRPLRVINAGVPGYTLFQGYVYLQRYGMAMEPNAVLLYFGYNDFLPVAFRQERDAQSTRQLEGPSDWALYRERQRPLARLATWFYRHSNIYRGLESLLPGPKQLSLYTLNQFNTNPRVPAHHRSELLERIHRLCAENGVHLSIIIPWYRDFQDHAALLRRFARDHHVTCIDLPEELSSHHQRSVRESFLDSLHPNAAGHRLIAERVAAIVEPAWREFDARR